MCKYIWSHVVSEHVSLHLRVRVCTCICICLCVHACDASPPCGVMVWIGLAVTRTFHVVRVPSEWLHTNCFPSWCQATEWMACSTHRHTHTHAQTETHTYQNICKVGTIRTTSVEHRIGGHYPMRAVNGIHANSRSMIFSFVANGVKNLFKLFRMGSFLIKR